MTEPKRLETLSAVTRAFLAAGEGQLVDFKRTSDGISADDLVSFANAAEGGTILSGIGEQKVAGAQVGFVVGCDVSDNAILQLLNKAISCLPPVSIDVVIENLSDKPILRVSIPSSPTRPHCTPKGIYCRRDGARNRALHPSELLGIFLETEAQVFAERFESAASHISEEIGTLEETLSNTIRSMSDQLGWAESNIDDASSTMDTILAFTKRVESHTADTADRMRALFRQDSRKDPVRDRELEKLTERLVEQISGDGRLKKAILADTPLSYKLKGRQARELTADDVKVALAKAARIIRAEEDRKNYQWTCSSPSDCEERIIDAFVARLTDGRDASAVRKEVTRASLLGLVTYKGDVIATGGLRKPSIAKRRSIFDRERASADPKRFTTQLDWVGLHTDHRSKGILTDLITKVLASTNDRPVFTLTDEADELGREIAVQFGFEPAHRQTDPEHGGGKSERLFLLQTR